jgi:hypothetical protein
MRTQIRLPNLNNATPSSIVDECAPLQAEYNRLDKLTKYYKVALKARLTDEYRIDPLTYQITGEKYAASISDQTSSRLDMDKLRKLLTEEQIQSCYSESKSMVIRFALLEPES